MPISQIDTAIQSTFPVVVAPVDGELLAPTQAGTRFLMTHHGVMREVSNHWMTSRQLVAPAALPYGEVQDGVTFHVAAPPRDLLQAFVEQAKLALPNEAAGLLAINTTNGQWALYARLPSLVTPDRIDYIEPTLDENEVAVVDIHSHGRDRAFFSRRDDADDFGGIKLSAVVGQVHTDQPQFAMRLVVVDKVQPILIKDGYFTVATSS